MSKEAKSKSGSEGIESPLKSRKYTAARQQPKSPTEEQMLKEKYAKIESLEERAYAILLDLGMIESTDDDGNEGAFQ